MATSEEPPPDATSSDMSGSARDIVQARDTRGGIHFHGRDESSAPIPAQLPGDVYGFVNRAGDMEALDEFLGRPGQIAVCVLTGTPGIGKTALASCQEAMIISRRSGDRQREARSLAGAGAACRALGRFEEAAGFHHAALAAWRSMGDAWQSAVTLSEFIRDMAVGGLAGDDQQLRDEALGLIRPFTDPAAQRLRESLDRGTGSSDAVPEGAG
jgi:hypothetical protein